MKLSGGLTADLRKSPSALTSLGFTNSWELLRLTARLLEMGARTCASAPSIRSRGYLVGVSLDI
jgi:hypothetical protein